MFASRMKIVTILALALTVAGCAGNRSFGERVDDAGITASVKSRLAADPTAKAYQINVDTNEGVVQLNGFVDSQDNKQAAERIAKAVDGVKRVDNNLTVGDKDRTFGEAMGDTGIATRVKTALAADASTKSYQIKVDVNGGNVELGGFVDTESSKDNASRVVRSVDGVKSVQNNLVVQK